MTQVITLAGVRAVVPDDWDTWPAEDRQRIEDYAGRLVSAYVGVRDYILFRVTNIGVLLWSYDDIEHQSALSWHDAGVGTMPPPEPQTVIDLRVALESYDRLCEKYDERFVVDRIIDAAQALIEQLDRERVAMDRSRRAAAVESGGRTYNPYVDKP